MTPNTKLIVISIQTVNTTSTVLYSKHLLLANDAIDSIKILLLGHSRFHWCECITSPLHIGPPSWDIDPVNTLFQSALYQSMADPSTNQHIYTKTLVINWHSRTEKTYSWWIHKNGRWLRLLCPLYPSKPLREEARSSPCQQKVVWRSPRWNVPW